jgi:outer membrane biosynthesis protein TonB
LMDRCCRRQICCHPDDVCTTSEGTVYDVRAQQSAALKAHEEEATRRSLAAETKPADANVEEKKTEKKPEKKTEKTKTRTEEKKPEKKTEKKKEKKEKQKRDDL